MEEPTKTTAEMRAQIEKARRLARDSDAITGARLTEYADALANQLQDRQDRS